MCVGGEVGEGQGVGVGQRKVMVETGEGQGVGVGQSGARWWVSGSGGEKRTDVEGGGGGARVGTNVG